MQVAKADPHRFTLYRTDFLPGTSSFCRGGARFNLMFSRLPGWLGPVIVEWTPDEPGLAEARRQAVLATLQRAGRPIPRTRRHRSVALSGSLGVGTGNNFGTLIIRSQQSGPTYPPSPQSGAYGYSIGGGQRIR